MSVLHTSEFFARLLHLRVDVRELPPPPLLVSIMDAAATTLDAKPGYHHAAALRSAKRGDIRVYRVYRVSVVKAERTKTLVAALQRFVST